MPPQRRQRIHIPLQERIHDGRVYEVSHRARTGVIYMKCATRLCAGTAKKLRDHGDIIPQKGHSACCYGDRNAQLIADFKDALRSALGRHFWKLKELYETVVALYPREIKVLVPYNTILSSLKRWRMQFYPPSPETLEKMGQQLDAPDNERLLSFDGGRLVSRRIIDSSGNLHLLIYNPQFVQSKFRYVSRIFIDGTFKTTPRVRGVYQLVTILGITYDHAIPFAHILMSNKTQNGYSAVLTEAISLINGASVRVVMTDFEQALRNTCKALFVNARVVGCDTHYDRALLKKAKALRLLPVIRESEVAKLFLKKIMALAYLPPELIEAEYHILKNSLPLELKRSFSAFLIYYERQWIRIVKPIGFAVFGLSRRTNNVVESYNSILADKMGEHPSAWTFMAKLMKLTSNAIDDVESLQLLKRIKRHPRYASIYKHNQLIKAWRQLHSSAITPSEFVDMTASLKGHITQRMANITNEDLENTGEVMETQDNDAQGDPDYDHHIFQDLRYDDVVYEHALAPAIEEPEHLLDILLPGRNEPPNGAIEENNDRLEIEQGRQIEQLGDMFNEEQRQDARAGFPEIRREEEIIHVPEADETLREEEIIHVQEGNDTLRPEEIIHVQEGDELDIELVNNVDNMHPEDEVIYVTSESETQSNHSDDEPERGNMFNVDPGNSANTANDLPVDNNEVPTAATQIPSGRASKSRRKNMRKKRNRRIKIASGNVPQVRPYGGKRRRNKKVPKCVVCKANTITHGFVPCGHNCVCLECANGLDQRGMNTCPKCRQPFTQFLVIYNEA